MKPTVLIYTVISHQRFLQDVLTQTKLTSTANTASLDCRIGTKRSELVEKLITPRPQTFHEDFLVRDLGDGTLSDAEVSGLLSDSKGESVLERKTSGFPTQQSSSPVHRDAVSEREVADVQHKRGAPCSRQLSKIGKVRFACPSRDRWLD